MSVIMPTGKKYTDWSLELENDALIKTASTDNKEMKSNRDILYEAALKALKKNACGVVADAKEDALDKAVDALDEAKDAIEEAKAADDTTVTDDTTTPEMGDTETVDIVVDDAKPEVDEVEFEIEGEDEVCDKKDEECKDENPEEKKDDEIIIKSEEGCDEKDEKAEKPDETEIMANADEEFVKMSKISPTTRKKIYTFWAEYLGYPKDYCKLLVKDYEK